MTDIHIDALPGRLSAEAFSDSERADSSDFPELPWVWEGKRAELLREVWPQLNQQQRREWIARINKLHEVLAEDAAAFEELKRMHNRTAQQGLIELLQRLQAEDSLLDPAESEADWEDLKAALNANRAPAPPLFP